MNEDLTSPPLTGNIRSGSLRLTSSIAQSYKPCVLLRGLAIQLVHGSPHILLWLDCIFISWSLRHPPTISGAPVWLVSKSMKYLPTVLVALLLVLLCIKEAWTSKRTRRRKQVGLEDLYKQPTEGHKVVVTPFLEILAAGGKMSISMSRFEFFCHRPTIVALIDLGIDMGTASSGTSGPAPSEEEDATSVQKDKAEENEQAKVKGLLGHGKSRTVFSMAMNIDSVIVYLNKEDGSQLAMIVQERFMLGLKVKNYHPSLYLLLFFSLFWYISKHFIIHVRPGSISVEGTLVNFRLCDCSLGTDHVWGWIFDIRNQGAESLIQVCIYQFSFESYSPKDDDYEGYNFSLSGKLSSIRIVFLNRFIQDVSFEFLSLHSN
ncbi:unnamed protein product [Lactuca virosa]|uniref:Uncharacterized protein n=1 Tax=Lactuca virosa TaxID=75947 RepID=A0AAU9N4D9_9ASTR|nr:unnamed protein product [Lactuca virosa]